MEVIRAGTAGFCMGVSLALQKLEAALRERTADTERICTLGPIIHNPQVQEEYAAKGVARLDDPEQARPGDVVVIRAHGVTRQTEERLRKLTVLATICDATRERQEEARNIASRVDAMVVVGGRESGNTRRLADVARAAGIPTYHVERVDELQADLFAQNRRAGLTAGASTPKSLIDAAEERLASL